VIAILKRTSRSASVQGGNLALDGDLVGVVSGTAGLELFTGEGLISDEDGLM
jgi:hypothetical protein